MRRSVRVDVEEFVAARADTLLRTAYLLTGDPARAEQLLETGLAHAWATWGHSELGPESTVRAAMVRQRDLWWPTRRRDAGRDPTRDPRWAALDRLSRRQRAALVLCCFDDVPEDDAAEILGCQVGTLRRRLARAREAFGVPDPAQALAALADPVSPRNAAARIADVEHRVAVQRAWRRTEAVASLMAATVAVLVVVAALPTTPRRQADTLPQLNMVEPPPALVGYQLPATLHVKGQVYGYFRSQESAPGQPSLLVAVASAPQPQLLTWVSPVALTGWIVVSVDGDVVARNPAGRFDRGLLLSPRQSHLVAVRTTRPDVSVRLGIAVYQRAQR